jgi:hypothetical protein
MPLSVVLLALAIAAKPLPVEDALTRGRAALQAGEPTQALEYFEQAAQQTDDPGLVAFEQGKAYFALGQYRSAALAFQQCTEDSVAPDERRTKARYNRGVCYLRRGGLAEYQLAVQDFSVCLAMADDEAFAADVRYNLELAKTLWYAEWQKQRRQPQAVAEPPQTTQPPPQTEPEAPPPAPPEEFDPTEQPSMQPGTSGSGTELLQPQQVQGEAAPGNERRGGKGLLPVKFRGDDLPHLNDSELSVYFEQLRQRITKVRTANKTQTPRPTDTTIKDW